MGFRERRMLKEIQTVITPTTWHKPASVFRVSCSRGRYRTCRGQSRPSRWGNPSDCCHWQDEGLVAEQRKKHMKMMHYSVLHVCVRLSILQDALKLS